MWRIAKLSSRHCRRGTPGSGANCAPERSARIALMQAGIARGMGSDILHEPVVGGRRHTLILEETP